jgi:hypothetical protein
MASLYTSGFYEQFSLLQDSLQPFLLTKMLEKDLSTISCEQFFENGLEESSSP